VKTEPGVPKDIDEYISGFTPEVQKLLTKVRAVIRKSAPGAEEAIKYRLATFVFHGNLVHFGAFKSHLGFYPTSSGTAHFKADLSAYEGSKGAVRFPFDQPIPYDLIERIVKFRVTENLARAKSKRTKR